MISLSFHTTTSSLLFIAEIVNLSGYNEHAWSNHSETSLIFFEFLMNSNKISWIMIELWSEKFEWFGPSPIEPFNLAGHGRAGGREQEQDREAWRETTQVWNGRGHWLLPRRFEPWSVPSFSFRPLSFTHIHACLVCFEHLLFETFWELTFRTRSNISTWSHTDCVIAESGRLRPSGAAS